MYKKNRAFYRSCPTITLSQPTQVKEHIFGDLLSTIFPIAVKKAETIVIHLLHTSPKISFPHEHKASVKFQLITTAIVQGAIPKRSA